MEKVSTDQRLEVGEEVMKADTWLKNSPEKENSYSKGSHDSIDSLTDLENYSQKNLQNTFKYATYRDI